MNRQTGNEMFVNFVKLHVSQELHADGHSKSQYDHAPIWWEVDSCEWFFEEL